ncbi:hypothetical protein PHYSODRAFT_512012 [Phytophthora sojae]|uniref:Transposase zinc-ribbon domain-containing protein n=1 Tax=Phytophthora sojae (strain P6497) TaxID=1094619 RepID=G4ZQW0_PHYSP|nr:hypothetical protein PHYSODRAFT_512012 [Phytophthora sojae]EGZ13908.1 hypothetical protein PHYSODRAFT_512012 [Phytophthora sojae]|eukprot:XP_009531337.1 hypothetical protein PHYSODRAFT_512012 [Phytophthora sojae]
MSACATEKGALEWAQRVGLLASAPLCPTCTNGMTLYVAVKRTRWSCSRTGCSLERSVRASSFFARSSAPLSKLIKLLLFWAFQHPVTTAAQQAEVSPTTAGQWYVYVQDICTAEMKRTLLKVKSYIILLLNIIL